MPTINVLVRDSYHTGEIAATLRGFFKGKAVCYEENVPADLKIDVFVLSGLNVLKGGPSALSALRASTGSEKAKVIVTSTMDDILEEIRASQDLEVDFTIPKSALVDGLSLADDAPHNIHKSILSEVLSSFSKQRKHSNPRPKKRAKTKPRA